MNAVGRYNYYYIDVVVSAATLTDIYTCTVPKDSQLAVVGGST